MPRDEDIERVRQWLANAPADAIRDKLPRWKPWKQELGEHELAARERRDTEGQRLAELEQRALELVGQQESTDIARRGLPVQKVIAAAMVAAGFVAALGLLLRYLNII